jgi:hypothetical protein
MKNSSRMKTHYNQYVCSTNQFRKLTYSDETFSSVKQLKALMRVLATPGTLGN